MAGHFDFVKFAGKTDVGRKRKNNEDNFGMFPEIGVWLVADGMGGGEDGEVASAAVVRAVSGFAEAHPFPANAAAAADPLVSGLSDAIDAASQWIYNRTRERGLKSCASTVVGVAIDRTHPGRAVAFHAGDSRLYLIRNGGLFGGGIRQVTTDHSAAEAMGVREKDKLNPMWVNVITRAVGLHECTDVERTPFDVKKGDRILICSDGLSGMVGDNDLLEISKNEADVGKAVEKLIAAANAAGGKDNVTAVLLQIGELPKRDVEVKPLEELAVGEERATPDDGVTRPTCPTIDFESLPGEKGVHGSGVPSGLTEASAAGLDESGEPRSACLDKDLVERMSGLSHPSLSHRVRGVKAWLDKLGRRRLVLWGLVALALASMSMAVVWRLSQSGSQAAVKPMPVPVSVSVPPTPKPEPPTPKPEPPRIAVPVAAAVTNIAPATAPVVAPEMTPVSVPEVVTNVQSAVVTNLTPAVDGSLAALAEAFDRKSLSQFEAAVKNALQRSGDEGLRQIGEFTSEMRKVSARAAKYVNEIKYVKGSSRSAEDLVVDFKYALEKVAMLRPQLGRDLKSKWEIVSKGDVKDAKTREAAAALVSGLTEALK